jgi:hypothetical protein
MDWSLTLLTSQKFRLPFAVVVCVQTGTIRNLYGTAPSKGEIIQPKPTGVMLKHETRVPEVLVWNLCRDTEVSCFSPTRSKQTQGS